MTASDLIPTGPQGLALAELGAMANHAAGASVFADYRARKAANTRRRQDGDLALFADYLRALGQQPGELGADPAAWAGLSWGLVSGFARWLILAGYAISSVNVRLSTVKGYATLAAQAGALDAGELALIRAVKGYKRAEGKHVDDLRAAEGINTRRQETRTGQRSNKKAQPVTLSKTQAAALKTQPDTPQGRRDALIMALLLDHGLRVGELARLAVADFDLKAGELHFYRPKVDKVQTHRLTPDTLRAARAYLGQDAPALGVIWRASASKRDGKDKRGELTTQGISARAITERVNDLGARAGLVDLRAHDCRHYWATQAARNGTALDRLQDAGGWSSLAMPARYIEAAKIANEGVRLD
jgi:integrase